MAHPETLLPMTEIEDPIDRFVAVTKFYLSGWHIKPPGVKKPLNPILGEIFTGYWDYPDGTKGYYISEQTSHHPPKSSYFFMAPEHHIRIDGTLKPRSKFLGNSAASMMEGIAVMRFLNTGERFFVTQPNMYARGILFGKMKYELGDHSYIRCPETGMVADIEFKTKGYFGGTYNAIGGFIKDKNDKQLFELSGLWNEEMWIKDLTTGKKELLFDASHAKPSYPKARPLEEQDERESQKLWHEVTEAVKRKDQDTATNEKARIEDRQREEAAKRMNEGVDWHPQLFRRVQGGHGGSEEGEEDLDWIINAKVDGKTPQEQIKQVLEIAAILPGQAPHRKFSIPALSRTNTNDPAAAGNHAIQQSHPIQSNTNPEVSKSDPDLQQKQQTFGDLIDLSDPTPNKDIDVNANNPNNPPQLPLDKPKSQPENFIPEKKPQDEFAEDLPPSKLLNFVQEEPGQGPALKRMDTETEEEEQFHDAHS
ncbi:Oxysterol-binding protein OBPa [Didymosphaeria variabile]|uniref:Oxysterol-binding protein OBPa n=1 Tax=Didymosphaeria variabile TaxID=1932322 RepID=A0A9W8XJX4_9PLEO|nr:Oxysterol-binding protein OBPa [Didymosphaeria variabile]KAJ4352247.1 Oxysterol-binding protein OBPa [Didymosphaeria variabile]